METQPFLFYAVVVLTVFAAALLAYQQGYIEKLGVYLLKARAKAEAKAEGQKLKSEGLHAGEDSVKGNLKGSSPGIGSIGGLKKSD